MLHLAGKPVRVKKNTLGRCGKKEYGSEIIKSQQAESNEIFGVTIKVAEAGYIPAGVKLRGQISANLFTATVTPKDMENLETDSKVVSISAPRKLHAATNGSVA